jgi:hypothetical protein
MPARPVFSKQVEVIAVNRAVEATTGDSIYQVVFGELVPLTPETRPHFPQPVGTLPPKKLGANVMVLFFNSRTAAPYRVGSKWVVEIAGDGAVSVRERAA